MEAKEPLKAFLPVLPHRRSGSRSRSRSRRAKSAAYLRRQRRENGRCRWLVDGRAEKNRIDECEGEQNQRNYQLRDGGEGNGLEEKDHEKERFNDFSIRSLVPSFFPSSPLLFLFSTVLATSI